MSEDQLKAFLAALKDDAVLQAKLTTATDADAVIAIALEAGFVISRLELKRVEARVAESDLESVAGGYGCFLSICHNTVADSYGLTACCPSVQCHG